MTAAWISIAVLCAGTVAIKSVGPVAVGGSPPSERVSSVIRLIAPALLAALIVYEALSADGHGPQFDARLVGVGAAALGLLRAAAAARHRRAGGARDGAGARSRIIPVWSSVTSPSPLCARSPSAPAPSASCCCSTRARGRRP